MRPEFQATVKAKKKNPVTQNYEPHMRSMERCVRVMSSLIFIVFLVCMSLSCLLFIHIIDYVIYMYMCYRNTFTYVYIYGHF